VIYVVVGLPPPHAGYPEVSDRNATFNGLRASAYSPRVRNAKIHPAVAPLREEIVRHQASGERLRRDRSRLMPARQTASRP